ncbi:MAG: SdiA-regulated domain-containing protein [Rhodothermales bacterium]
MKAPLIVFALILSVPFGACQPSDPAASPRTAASPAQTISDAGTSRPAPYRFDQPAAVFTLPPDLREISALTVLDGRHLGAVEDETGTLYLLDVGTGEIAAVMPFGSPGDYEGVELASGRLFVLRSDGTLFEVEGWEGGDTRLRTHATGLGPDCDAEGLGYDAARARLLIACKEDGIGDQKAVYAFDLTRDTFTPEPAFVIDPDAVPGRKKLKPSAVAVHPVTGETVVLSSKRKALVALTPGGTVADVWSIEAAGFEQPEALAFLPNGDLFVASEGDDGPPVLVRFSYEGLAHEGTR